MKEMKPKGNEKSSLRIKHENTIIIGEGHHEKVFHEKDENKEIANEMKVDESSTNWRTLELIEEVR
jgi:hypothetical protein